MRPIATQQSQLRYPLNELFSTPANVRLLRLFADGVREPIGANEAALRTGMTATGARRALLKLAKTGFVERIGSGHAHQYALREGDQLCGAIRTLFQCERDRYQSLLVNLRSVLKPLSEIQAAWIDLDENPLSPVLYIGILSDARSLVYLGEQIRQRIVEVETEFNVTIEVRTLSRADMVDFDNIQMIFGYLDDNTAGVAGTHADRDKRAIAFSQAIVELLDTDPALWMRATRHLNRILLDEPGTAKHDIKEWREILVHYSKQRLSDFLVSDTPRAQRLRQSSPFFAVLTRQQRDLVFAAADQSNDT